MLIADEIEKKISAYYCCDSIIEYKYKRFLAMVYLTFLLAATVVAYRMVLIGSIPEPGSTLIYATSFFLMNVYTELYGAESSKKLIFEVVCCGYLFALLLHFVNSLPAPEYWDTSGAYDEVLGHILRFTNAGVVGYLMSALLNIFLIKKWKYKMHGRLFWLRSLLASSISEGLATFIAGMITFFGMMPSKKILLVMSSALMFKIIYGFLVVWPASVLVYFLKKAEKR